MGEIVFLDPFASHDDQLRKFATLSMLSGPHLKGRSPSGFSRTFFSLFKPANDLVGILYVLFLCFIFGSKSSTCFNEFIPTFNSEVCHWISLSLV